jgi:hypothetical protein
MAVEDNIPEEFDQIDEPPAPQAYDTLSRLRQEQFNAEREYEDASRELRTMTTSKDGQSSLWDAAFHRSTVARRNAQNHSRIGQAQARVTRALGALEDVGRRVTHAQRAYERATRSWDRPTPRPAPEGRTPRPSDAS